MFIGHGQVFGLQEEAYVGLEQVFLQHMFQGEWPHPSAHTNVYRDEAVVGAGLKISLPTKGQVMVF